MKTKTTTTIMLTIFLLHGIMMTFPVSGYNGVTFSAWAWTLPTIDGTIDTAVEWAGAATTSFTSTEGVEGTFYVMNDGDNLYLAVKTTDPTLDQDGTGTDAVWIYFDNNNDGIGPDAGDDIIGWNGYLSEGFKDGYSDGTYSWRRDADDGGDSDGSAEATNDGTYNYFEISHPLDTTDDAHDFSLSIGDAVGFAIRFTVDGVSKGWWPSSDLAEWHDIEITSRPILSAWTWIPPTIDGIIDPAVEWANAATASFMSTGGLEGIFYFMNDGGNLYIAVRTTDPTLSQDTTINDKVFIYFDNNDDGIGPEIGDDIIGWNGYESEGFKDGYSDGTYVWRRDTDAGGSSDGLAEATNDGMYNYFEIAHPLDTFDDAHDFSLSTGDIVGFTIRFAVDGVDKGYWPASDPAEWNDIEITSRSIYIRADGSVDPPTAPISSGDNITYTFTNNVYYPIVVERDNIVVNGAGITVQGTGTGIGMNLTGTSNVTIKNMEIKAFQYGIWVYKPYQLSNNKIFGNIIRNNTFGVWIFASNNSLSGNTITNNTNSGVVVDLDSSNNTISGNNITNNIRGVWLIIASDNKFYHNNFVNNTQHVHIPMSGHANFWDDGVEGSYWSDYNGIDSDHDGIGDSAYEIDTDNVDHCPLMGVFSSFNASLGYHVNVISNSSIQDFQYIGPDSTIKMYVSNMTVTQTFGFCRVCIPKNLMSPPYTVIINDGATEVLHFNGTLNDNDTHRWIYFAYEHSTHEVDIIPEFPSFLILPLFMIATLLAVVIYRRKVYANIQR